MEGFTEEYYATCSFYKALDLRRRVNPTFLSRTSYLKPKRTIRKRRYYLGAEDLLGLKSCIARAPFQFESRRAVKQLVVRAMKIEVLKALFEDSRRHGSKSVRIVASLENTQGIVETASVAFPLIPRREPMVGFADGKELCAFRFNFFEVQNFRRWGADEEWWVNLTFEDGSCVGGRVCGIGCKIPVVEKKVSKNTKHAVRSFVGERSVELNLKVGECQVGKALLSLSWRYTVTAPEHADDRDSKMVIEQPRGTFSHSFGRDASIASAFEPPELSVRFRHFYGGGGVYADRCLNGLRCRLCGFYSSTLCALICHLACSHDHLKISYKRSDRNECVVNTWLRPESRAHLESLFGRNDTKIASEQHESLPQTPSLFKVEPNDEEGLILPAVESSPTNPVNSSQATIEETVPAATTAVKTEASAERVDTAIAVSSMSEAQGERKSSKRAALMGPSSNFVFIKTKGTRGRVVADILKKCAEPEVRWQDDMEGFGDDWNDRNDDNDDDDYRGTTPPGGSHEEHQGGNSESKQEGGGSDGRETSGFLDGEQNTAGGLDQQDQGCPVDEKHTKKDVPFKWKKFSRQFYHSSDMTPCLDQDLGYDSDDDQNVDNQWLIDQNRQSIEELEDASIGEKTYMIKWNHFVASHEIYADMVFPSMCEMFARLHGKWLLENKLRTNFLLHLLTMWEFKLVSTRTIQKCMVLVDTSGGDIARHSLTLNRAVAEKEKELSRNIIVPVNLGKRKERRHDSGTSKMLVGQL